MKLTAIQRNLLLSALVFAGVVGAYYEFWMVPMSRQITQLKATLDQKKKDLEEAKRMVAKYAEFKKRADSVLKELEWIQGRMPKAVERGRLLEAISVAQSRSGLVSTKLQFLAVPPSKGAYSEIPVSLRMSGDYKGLLDFLYQTTLADLFLTAKDITVLPLADTAHPGLTLSVQMTLNGVQSK